VASSLIEASDLSARVEVMTRFIEMAETARQLGNFFGMAAIVSGLNGHVAKVFKKAWAVYPSKPHIILLQDMSRFLFELSSFLPLSFQIDFVLFFFKTIFFLFFLLPHSG
jgi:hypothetical protein